MSRLASKIKFASSPVLNKSGKETFSCLDILEIQPDAISIAREPLPLNYCFIGVHATFGLSYHNPSSWFNSVGMAKLPLIIMTTYDIEYRGS